MSLYPSEYFESLKIPYEEIASATNNFATENLIAEQGSAGSSSSAKLYKGQLLLSGHLIDVVAHKFQYPEGLRKEFLTSYFLYQNNLSFLVGVCVKDVNELFVVKKHWVNGSLDKHLSGSTLTWLQRLHICLGVSQALSCLHYKNTLRDDHYMIHGDIKSSKILLDDNWEPKLQGSRFYAQVEKRRLYITNHHTDTLQYMDPAYETTGSFTHKSDMFSLGVVFFELLFSKKAEISNNDNWYFAKLARSHYKERKLDELIDPDVRKEMDHEAFKLFSETAYFCLKEDRETRPDIKLVVKRLERALELQKKHSSPEQSIVSVEITPSRHLEGQNLNYLRIPLSDIKLATEDFSENYYIGSGGYGRVYKAKLNHLPGQNSPTIVAIKHIISREDKQGEKGFLSEIEMLVNCKHPNVITLLGFCEEDFEMLLIYEYASNGSLEGYFEDIYNINRLTWTQRIQICLNIAHGLEYLHTRTSNKEKIIHRDIKSANILLDDNWIAKIADFGLSKLHDVNQHGSTLVTSTVAGTQLYLDPVYRHTGKLKRASDIYSFGVVMFEILCGKLAYDPIYGEKGLPSIVRECFHDETLNKIIDPILKEAEQNMVFLNQGLYQNSLDTFSRIAHQCLAETQEKRPSIEIIIKELEKALDVQINFKDNLQIPLGDIKLATRNFSDSNCIGEGMFWMLYEGEVQHNNALRCTTIVAKRWKSCEGDVQFKRELEVLHTLKHENIIGLVGYCTEMNEKIIVYEHSSNGRLDNNLSNVNLTWMRRLNICIDIASGLEFLHAHDVASKPSILHRDIKSCSILLDGDWEAKLSNLELSLKSWEYEQLDHITNSTYGSLDYADPTYVGDFLLTEKSDIYSFGVVLMEILSGRLACAHRCEDRSLSLGPLAKNYYIEGKLDELVFEAIRDQIVPESLTMFQNIALQCLEEKDRDRPSATDVVQKLKMALEFQEEHEIWKPKLPRGYKEIIKWSNSPDVDNKKDVYNMLLKGILLQGGKVFVSLGTNGETNKMISAKSSFRNHRSHEWKSIPTSRFQKVAKMSNISNLKTQIKTRTHFLSQGVSYGVYLIFKFCEPRKISTTPMYVNLTYKIGNETLHSYFAKWRDSDWMMIELCRYFTLKEKADFMVILESFSRYYCKSGDIYIEGIEFRAINNEKHEQVGNSKVIEESLVRSKETPKRSRSYDEGEKVIVSKRIKVNKKKNHILSAKEAIYDSSNMKVFCLRPSPESRFKEIIELLAQQVLHFKFKIESQMLSANTKYSCYLVFKFSEKCRGLHCPMMVRDLLRWNNKEAEILYLRSPSPINRHNTNRISENREDGCMEVCMWKGNSNGKFKNGCLLMNLKLIIYEGTMSGLIVYGLEFRPT